MNNNMTTDKPMSNEEVIEVLKGIVFNSFDRTTPKERQALVLAFKTLEKNNEMLEYLKACLSQSDELKEKHRNVDDDGLKEYSKRMAIIFEGMGEAYADLIDRFFKEDSDHDK